jgi:hypothetical protein
MDEALATRHPKRHRVLDQLTLIWLGNV